MVLFVIVLLLFCSCCIVLIRTPWFSWRSPLDTDDRPGKADKRDRTFKILSKKKSFYIRAPTVELKTEWLNTIQEQARCVLFCMEKFSCKCCVD
jgi:hypothetical protein